MFLAKGKVSHAILRFPCNRDELLPNQVLANAIGSG